MALLVPVAARSKAQICGRPPTETMGSKPAGSMDVCCQCCVLSDVGLYDELITHPEGFYQLRCVVVCDLETSRMRRPRPALSRSVMRRGQITFLDTNVNPRLRSINTYRY